MVLTIENITAIKAGNSLVVKIKGENDIIIPIKICIILRFNSEEIIPVLKIK